ncbi:hypothetical protein M8818_001288 [Zalaria obscura]|uniref:Uncharacterized protein n=1 Tax=Zalaria obscura TaxID=2024903 RepID=A0ACC3SMR8_9PEZI
MAEMGGRSTFYEFFKNNSQKLLDGLIAAIAAKSGRITSLQLGSEIGLGIDGSPIHHDYLLQMDINPGSRLVFSQIVSLKIVHFRNVQDVSCNVPEMSGWQALLSTATALRNLELWAFDPEPYSDADAVIPGQACPPGPIGTSLFSGLLSSPSSFPSLERLSLKDSASRPATEFNMKDLIQFLRRHKSTIKSVELCGLFPNQCYGLPAFLPNAVLDHATMKATSVGEAALWITLLYCLRDDMMLQSAHVYPHFMLTTATMCVLSVCGFMPGRVTECRKSINYGLFALRSEEETEAKKIRSELKMAEGALCELEETCMEEHIVGQEEIDSDEVGSEDDD